MGSKADRDAKLDIAAASPSSAVTVLLGKGNGTFFPVTNYRVVYGSASMAIGDINGDNRPDIAVANQTSSTLNVLINRF